MHEVSQYTHLVKHIAYRLITRLPNSVEVDDLVQAGMIGLIEASRRFDAAAGTSFQAFACPRIHGAMLDEIRKGDWTPRSVHRKGREMAEGLHAEDQLLRADLARRAFQSLQEYELDDDENWYSVFASSDPGPAEIAEHDELIGRLIKAIDTLPERERQILALYYDEGLQLKEIGALLGLTESRISQLRSQALKRLSAKVNH